MKKWKKYKRTKLDKEKGYELCPKCKKDTLSHLIEGGEIIAEKCNKGCYIHYFDK